MRVHPSWPAAQLNQPYACEVAGLNYNNNCLRITVRRSGSRAVIIVDPHTNYLKFSNKVKLTSSGNSAVGAYRNKTPNVLTLKGKCRKETGFGLAIENPAMMFATMLKESLTKAGITVKGSAIEKHAKSETGIEIFRTYKTPIADVLMRCNKDSLNMAAESLIKTISAEYTAGRVNGQWKHGFELVGKYLGKLDISPDEYKLDDGCGLSRNNRVSANAIVGVLGNICRWNHQKIFPSGEV
jgi:D-alanyl-D-alanine carboxypeptidase/D-alanyl-D-alanine-endopeptidase (penicillin-binding protein 4)